jgi:hypothetical protein
MSSKKSDIEERLEWLEGVVSRLKPRSLAPEILPPSSPEERADYIGFGTPQHMVFLGIAEVDDAEAAKKEGAEVFYTSPRTGKTYRLTDELGARYLYPQYAPEKAAMTTLREKVSSFESGPPEPPADAPPIWEPNPNYDAWGRSGLI